MGEDVGAIRGGCRCGAVRYEISGPPLAVAACHCTSCRQQSGAAFSVNLVIRASSMAVTGALSVFMDRETDSGAPLAREFCATCGSPIRSISEASPMIGVKAGTLEDPGSFPPTLHIWVRSALPWVSIPDEAPRFEKGPQM